MRTIVLICLAIVFLATTPAGATWSIVADDGIRPVVLPPQRATLDLLPLFADGFESGDTTGWSFVSP